MYISQNALLSKTYMKYPAAIRFGNISNEYNILTCFYMLFDTIKKIRERGRRSNVLGKEITWNYIS